MSTQKSPPSVTVYFVGSENEKLLNDINALTKDLGMSASAVGLLALKNGLPTIKKRLEGLSPKRVVNRNSGLKMARNT